MSQVPPTVFNGRYELQRRLARGGMADVFLARDRLLDRPVAIQRRSGVRHESATRLLAHLFQHQIHHRGQVHAMLAGTHVAPPQLDEFFCAEEARLRAADLAELGFSEAMIWESADQVAS